MPLKNLGLPPYTERASEASRNLSRGEAREAFHSKRLHRTSTPLLISALLLRQYGCGQVDIANYSSGLIMIFEVKSSFENFKPSQKKRLYRTVELLAIILDCDARLIVIN